MVYLIAIYHIMRDKFTPNQEQDHKVELQDVRKDTRELDLKLNEGYEGLLKEQNPVNFGKEGLIYRMSAKEMSPAMLEVFREAGIEITKDSAVKVLKVYKPGQGEKEYQAQMQAYKIIEDFLAEHPDLRGFYALVPTPIDYRRITLSDETQDLLNREGAHLTSNEVEILMMDFIEGEDLLETFYRWVAKHVPRDKEYTIASDPDSAGYMQLHQMAAGILEFGPMPPENTPEADMELENRRRKLYGFLQRTGYRMPGNTVEQIANTRKLLQKNNLYHNDEHERNFMVAGQQAYFLDFSRAATKPLEGEVEYHIDSDLEKLSESHYEAVRVQEMEQQQLKLQEIRSRTEDEGIISMYEGILKGSAGD
ncbi:MAG TPA: hypothetical protein VD998_03585, partial [Verrucomicrobiae bacterium]|nr:hypothetical protein [Verrucomicrobiae bacterium]